MLQANLRMRIFGIRMALRMHGLLWQLMREPYKRWMGAMNGWMVCPMHPEVLQDHPGNCPKYGMRLEPKTAKAGMGDAESADLRDMTQLLDRCRPCVAVFILAMVHLSPALGRQPWVNSDALRWMQFALATPVAWWAGWPLLHRGWRSVVGLLLSPIIAGAAMSLSPISVIGNALRLESEAMILGAKNENTNTNS